MADDQSTQDNGFVPLRPGDPVPEGGLDPTMVFASPPAPPPPPPSPSGSGGGMGDDGQQGQMQDDGSGAAMPPQDSGPPPPPPGTQATKEMGYDDEDLRVLAEVGDYRFGTITAQLTNDHITIPVHPETQFDDQAFLAYLRGSISLTRDEKWRIIQAIPKLSQFQVDELQKILDEERRKFGELSPKHLSQLMKLEQKHAQDWVDLQSAFVQQVAQQQETQQADDIRKQLGL
jgi:hypothetical protein